MPSSCCSVPTCSNRGGHKFPTNKALKRKWLVAIKRDKWFPTPHSLVCKTHFVKEDYILATNYGDKPMQHRLKPEAVPSIFSWKTPRTTTSINRTERLQKRLSTETSKNSAITPILEEDDILMEIEIGTSNLPKEAIEESQSTGKKESFRDVCTQTSANSSMLCIERIALDDKAIHYYTGLETYSKFQMVLSTLGPAAYCLQYRATQSEVLSTENQFFLTLIKLRRNTPDYELSLNFNISRFSISNIFVTWINFMYHQWQEIQIWPSRELVSFYMPEDFKKKFPETRVIIDGVEIPIQKPSSSLAQQATYSKYKNKNTLKIVVGISPGGLITSIPKAYNGSASDRCLVEKGNLAALCDSQDSIMADKGFDVQDLFAHKNIKVNTPTFMKGMNQLPGVKLLQDRKVSSKRIHVERIIGLGKTYKILQSPLTLTYVELGSQILFSCFMMCNFRKCIVGKEA